MLHFSDPACEELRPLTRDDPSAFAPPPAFGPFRVLHQVGVGALGPVFRTYEPTRDRLIAVKVFRLDITPEQAQSLAAELSRAADATLFHPSIVEPIAAGVQGTVAYRAEEYVAAESLDVAMRHYAPAPIDKVLPFITQLAGAIDFARAAGVGHGALHPRDVFVTPDEARAAGFGVVEALERVGLRAPVRRPYTAPERIEGREWGTPADVFSLAAIAFELLTARRPAGTGAQIGSLSGARVGAHENAIQAVLARAMDEDPDRRYPSALAFASALEATARGESVTNVAAPAEADERADVVPAAAAAIVPPAVAAVEERVVQPEGKEAFSEPVTLDDTDAERDEDEAHHALLEAERREREALESEHDRTLVSADEDEAEADRFADVRDEDDLPLREDYVETADLAHDRGAHSEPGALPPASASASRRPAESATYSAAQLASIISAARNEAVPVTEAPVVDREGPRMFPLAITLIAGLLLGFAAGYFVGGRDRDAEQASGSSTAATASRPGTSTPGQPTGGREWSEQTVARPPGSPGASAAQPPSVAPPVPSESPAPSGGVSGTGRPAPATRGRLVIQSSPSRANVTVDGQWRGRTPLTLENVPLGQHAIRVVQPGFDVFREIVNLSSSEPTRTLSVTLARPRTGRAQATAPEPSDGMGMLFVDSRPRGAQVFIDGRLVGTTPLRMPEVRIGSHVVRLELAGHTRWSTSTTVSAGREARVTGSLDPIQ